MSESAPCRSAFRSTRELIVALDFCSMGVLGVRHTRCSYLEPFTFDRPVCGRMGCGGVMGRLQIGDMRSVTITGLRLIGVSIPKIQTTRPAKLSSPATTRSQ